MTEVFAGDDGVRLMFSVAFLRETGDAPVSTDALLVGAASSSAAGSLFDSLELTPSVVRFVSRHRRGHWVSDDAAGVGPSGPHQLVMVPGGEPAPFTPAAAEAMRRAADTARLSGRATSSPVDVALSLLSDHANRAVEMVACCGLEVALLERVLESGEPSVAPSVDPGLRRARDVLLGRTQYSRRPGWRGLLTWSALPGRSSYALQPTLWAWLEARALAVADGRDEPGTHDLLLAVLAIHEVGTRYPHLSGSAADLYAGARMLATQLAPQLSATAGIGYAEAAATARRTDLGVDPRPLRAYVRSLPADTAALLGLVLHDHDTRAARLLLALGVDVTQLPVA